MSRKKLGNESFAPPAPDELTPLSLFSLMLSTSALCNATSRWLMANERELAEYGGYAAATDLQLVADVLLAMCEENLEVWQSMMVNMTQKPVLQTKKETCPFRARSPISAFAHSYYTRVGIRKGFTFH